MDSVKITFPAPLSSGLLAGSQGSSSLFSASLIPSAGGNSLLDDATPTDALDILVNGNKKRGKIA
jgi:hypothetical protein